MSPKVVMRSSEVVVHLTGGDCDNVIERSCDVIGDDYDVIECDRGNDIREVVISSKVIVMSLDVVVMMILL